MAQPLAFNDFLEVTVACHYQGQAGLNVLHYHLPEAPVGGITDRDLAEILYDRWQPVYAPWLPTVAMFEGVRVQIIRPGRYTHQQSIQLPSAGTGSDGICPPQCSGLIWTRARMAGARYRGRVYVPFPARSLVSSANSLLTVGGYAVLGAIGVELGPRISINEPGPGFGVELDLMTTKNGAPGDKQVTEMGVRQKVATQRRRSFFAQPNPVWG